ASRRRHTRFSRDWSSDVCSSDLEMGEIVEMADVVAFKLEPRAEGLADLGHDPLDIDIVVIHDAAARTLNILLFPGMLPILDALRSEERRVGKECRSR